MTFLTRIRHYRVYRSLVLSYLLLTFVTIALLSAILYSFFSSGAVKEIDRSSREMLSQVSYTADIVYKQVEDVTYQLLNDHQVITFMYASEENKQVNYNASLLLGRIQSLNAFISNIGIYNLTSGAYVDTAGLQPDREFAAGRQTEYMQLYPRKAVRSGRTPLNVLTFKIVPETSFANASSSVIFMDLAESYIQNTMRSISATQNEADNFIVDGSGSVLSHSDPTRFMANFADVSFVKDILADGRSQGSFARTIDGKKQLVTFVHSKTLDWTFVNVRPYEQLLSNIHELRNWTLIVAGLLLVVGTLFALFFSGSFYNPIKALLDKVNEIGGDPASAERKSPMLRFDEYEMLTRAFASSEESARTMRHSLDRSYRLLKSSSLFHVLRGPGFAEEAAGAAQEGLDRLRGPRFAVLLFRFDGLQAFKEQYNAFDRGLIRFAVGNIAHEVLSRSFENDIAIMEEEETAFLLQTDKAGLGGELHFLLGEIQDTVSVYYKISLSVAIGDLVELRNGIRDSYRSAQRYMQEKLFVGKGAILDAASANRPAGEMTRYPSSNERKLIDAIKLCHAKSIEDEVGEWIRYLSRCGHAQAFQYANFLFLALIREFENIAEWWDIDPNELYGVMNDVQNAETMKEIERILLGFCDRIVGMIEENKNNVAAAKNARVIEELKQFLNSQFADPALSLDIASDHVGLSAGYVGKLFRSVTGTSFNDYVTHVRMERAKTLLSETAEPIAQIGEKVGVYNVSYFSTLFKKKYGMTPSHFREQPPE